MKVTVTFKGVLAEGREEGAETVSLADDAVTTDLLRTCDVDPSTCIVVVNGAAVPRGARLTDGDRAQLYPAQSGG